MSGLAAHVDDYLRLRRGLGFTLAYDGVLLLQFVEYLQAQGAISGGCQIRCVSDLA